jgi:ribosomal protein S18 acetylase RimI-like enzyme
LKHNPNQGLQLSWTETKNFGLIAEQCEKWNSGKIYEIFWEYANLNAHILAEKNARSWLCYENGRLSGFALGRRVKGFYVVEELWAKFDGLFGDIITISEGDLVRAEAFRSQVLEEIEERPLLLRGAIDNHFAHGIARALKLPWFNGLILAKRTLGTRTTSIALPEDYNLREYASGDESFFSSLYRTVYSEKVSSSEFKEWATKSQSRTTVAIHGKERVGFIIAEKRQYDLLGDFAIAVSPTHQRKGIGCALLDAGLNSFRELGVRTVIADYRTFNGATHKLYGSRHFKPERIYNYFWIDVV